METLDDNEVDNSLSVKELIAKGRRDLLCLEVHSAVECFQHACELIAEQKGDFHDDLAEPNLLYGTALLELARSENQIFTEAVKNSEDENLSDEETEELGNEPQAESVNSISNKTETDNGAKIDSEVCDNTEIKPNITDSHTNDKDELLKDNNLVVDGKSVQADEADTDDVCTLQLAWEVIEVAKALFQKHETAVSQLKVADCLEKLAEISCEKEDHEQAISDLLECLELRLKHDADNSRLIAETHFQLGVAYSLLNNVHSSNTSFTKALDCLEKHKLLLESSKSLIKEKDADNVEVRGIEMQIKEISQLISEVTERRKENMETAVVVAANTEAKKPLIENAPAVDITHLIKKKRHVEESGDDAKKLKMEINATNDARKT